MKDIQPILNEIAGIVNRALDMKYRLFLFGSRAGEAYNPKADIDIGILADRPVDPETIVNFREEFENISTLLKIDFVDFAAVSREFRKVAMREIKEIVI